MLASLDHELLVRIVEFATPLDAPSLHLVCKTLRNAVCGAQIGLHPSTALTSSQLLQVMATRYGWRLTFGRWQEAELEAD